MGNSATRTSDGFPGIAALEEAYQDRISVNPRLTRALVSFQANRNRPVYRWFKFKEGFSSGFIEYILSYLGMKSGVLLDPFAGSGAALFTARERGWNGIGIELLPVAWFLVVARLSAERLGARFFGERVGKLSRNVLQGPFKRRYAFPHIRITRGAFPAATEEQIAHFAWYCDTQVDDPDLRWVFRLACMSVLEEVSYTRKDGQYLRWDCRSPRRLRGTGFRKGQIAGFPDAMSRKLHMILEDLTSCQPESGLFETEQPKGTLDMRRGSCLELLPTLPSGSVDLVITSPPYCNRYDYTRTYALELAYLGYGDEEVKSLRQRLLSCTVENRDKVAQLRSFYSEHGKPLRFKRTDAVFKEQAPLQEVLDWLDRKGKSGQLNNTNVPRMVRNYFYEMAFVICELARVVGSRGRVVMVNDNVRYAGREIPVDLFLSELAASFGFHVEQIWALPRGKGNSSQQMGVHGRQELRKCVYIWRKR